MSLSSNQTQNTFDHELARIDELLSSFDDLLQNGRTALELVLADNRPKRVAGPEDPDADRAQPDSEGHPTPQLRQIARRRELLDEKIEELRFLINLVEF